jgi:hypothetical protein
VAHVCVREGEGRWNERGAIRIVDDCWSGYWLEIQCFSPDSNSQRTL